MYALTCGTKSYCFLVKLKWMLVNMKLEGLVSLFLLLVVNLKNHYITSYYWRGLFYFRRSSIYGGNNPLTKPICWFALHKTTPNTGFIRTEYGWIQKKIFLYIFWIIFLYSLSKALWIPVIRIPFYSLDINLREIIAI